VSEEDALLQLAIDAARMAGALLAERARRGAEREVASKSTPTDLVSEADVASERAIRELLEQQRPQDGFVGEEGGAPSRARVVCAGSSTRWTERSTSSSAYRSGA
jgi:myo-inositol-1(or 4)-monophosphatase